VSEDRLGMPSAVGDQLTEDETGNCRRKGGREDGDLYEPCQSHEW